MNVPLQTPEEMDKCNGCNTDDDVFCCDILLPWGPYFLYREYNPQFFWQEWTNSQGDYFYCYWQS